MRQFIPSLLLHTVILIALFYQFDFEVTTVTNKPIEDINIENVVLTHMDPIEISLEDEPQHQQEDPEGINIKKTTQNKGTYQKAISGHIGSYFKEFLDGKKLQFNITLLLKIDAQGAIVFHTIQGAQDNKQLIEIFDRIINASDPVPAPPQDLLKDGFASFAIPIQMK